MINILFLHWQCAPLQHESSQFNYPRQSVEPCYEMQEILYPFLLAETSSQLHAPPPIFVSSEFQSPDLEQSWQKTIDSEFSGGDATEGPSTSKF